MAADEKRSIGFAYDVFIRKIGLPSDKIALGYLRQNYERLPVGVSNHYTPDLPPDADENTIPLFHLADTLIPEDLTRLLNMERYRVAYESFYTERFGRQYFCQFRNDLDNIRAERQELMQFYTRAGLAKDVLPHTLLEDIRTEIEGKIVKPYHPQARSVQAAAQDAIFVPIEPMAQQPASQLRPRVQAVTREPLEFEELMQNIALPSDKLTLGSLRAHHETKPVHVRNFIDSDKAFAAKDLVPLALSQKLLLERYIAYQMYVEAYGKNHFLGTSVSKHWQSKLTELKEFYIQNGLADGDGTARLLLKEINKTVGDFVKVRHGVEPKNSGVKL